MRLITKYGWIRTLHVATLRAKAFMRAPWAGGVVLLACVVAAMLLANLPATKIYYRHLLETELSVMVHSPTGVIDWIFPRGMNVEKLINDGLMVVFFFAVGLEIKREVVRGQALLVPAGDPSGGGRRGRHDRPGGRLHALQPRHARGFRVGEFRRPRTSPSPSVSSRCWNGAFPYRSRYSSWRWPSPTTWGAILVIAFFLRRRGPAGLPRAGAGDHARRLCDEAARGETHGLLSRSRRGRLEPVLLFGRPLRPFRAWRWRC